MDEPTTPPLAYFVRSDLHEPQPTLYLVQSANFTIGRHPASDLVVAFNFVSGRHATVTLHEKRHYLTDTSSFGTFLDGVQLQRDTPTLLRHGATIGLGMNVAHLRFFDAEQTVDVTERMLGVATEPAPEPVLELRGDLFWLGGTQLSLSRQEFVLLEALFRRQPAVVSLANCIAVVYHQPEDQALTKALGKLVARLRHKLGNHGRLIVSVRGRGYRYTPPTEGA